MKNNLLWLIHLLIIVYNIQQEIIKFSYLWFWRILIKIGIYLFMCDTVWLYDFQVEIIKFSYLCVVWEDIYPPRKLDSSNERHKRYRQDKVSSSS